MALASCTPSADSGSGTPLPSGAADRLHGYIAAETQDGRFSGIVLAVRGSGILFTDSSGLVDRTTRRKPTADTRFNLASVTKVFTAVAIGELADQHRLALTDLASKYLPSFRKPPRDKVTIANLLAHTGGTGDYLSESRYQEAKDRIRTVSELLAVINTDVQPGNTPGQTYAYSNTGYVVLGAVIEAVSGMDYFEFVSRNVFERSGMKHAGFFEKTPASQQKNLMAVGYRPDGRANWDALGLRGTPAGGAYASASDLVAFVKALRNGMLITAATRSALVMRPPPAGQPARGLTGVIAGGDVGVSTVLGMLDAADAAVVVLANQGDNAAPPIADRVIAELGLAANPAG